MSATKGYHADLYEIIYKGKPYAAEAAWIHNTISKYSPFKVKNMLELACGTGNHSLHLSGYGYSIMATDKTKDMVRVAEKKLAANRIIQVKQMDMVCFLNFKKPFDAIICLFDSIGFVQSNENILTVFKNVQKNLKKGGIFIFEYWNAGAMLRSYEPVSVKEWKYDSRKVIRNSTTELDYHNQLCKVNYIISEFENSKLIGKVKESHTNRFFLTQEMNSFLSSSGLKQLALYDGYSDKKRITKDSWHTVCVAQKK